MAGCRDGQGRRGEVSRTRRHRDVTVIKGTHIWWSREHQKGIKKESSPKRKGVEEVCKKKGVEEVCNRTPTKT